MRSEGPPPKRQAPSGPMGRRKWIGYIWFKSFILFLNKMDTNLCCYCFVAPMSRDRDPYGPPPPRRDSMMSRRDDYPSPRDDHYSSKDRFVESY